MAQILGIPEPPAPESPESEFFQVPQAALRAKQAETKRRQGQLQELREVLARWKPYAEQFHEDAIPVKQARLPFVDELYHNPKLGRVILALVIIGLVTPYPATAWNSVALVTLCCSSWIMLMPLLLVFLAKRTYQVTVTNEVTREWGKDWSDSWHLDGPDCLIRDTSPEEIQAAMLRWYNKIEAKANPQDLLNEEP